MTDEASTSAEPLERGKAYKSTGPAGEDIAIMTWDTWIDMNTGIESMRQALANQSRLHKEARVDYDAAMRRLADVTTRLENLRSVRRAEKRPEVEKFFEQPQPNKVTDHVRAAIQESNS
jgi:hypothetical protein